MSLYDAADEYMESLWPPFKGGAWLQHETTRFREYFNERWAYIWDTSHNVVMTWRCRYCGTHLPEDDRCPYERCQAMAAIEGRTWE